MMILNYNHLKFSCENKNLNQCRLVSFSARPAGRELSWADLTDTGKFTWVRWETWDGRMITPLTSHIIYQGWGFSAVSEFRLTLQCHNARCFKTFDNLIPTVRTSRSADNLPSRTPPYLKFCKIVVSAVSSSSSPSQQHIQISQDVLQVPEANLCRGQAILHHHCQQ